MKLSNLVATLALAAPTPTLAQVCPYENLMPEFAEFVAATGNLEPQARAEAFVARFAEKHRDFYSEHMFGSREKLLSGRQRLFDPQRAPKYPGCAADHARRCGRHRPHHHRRLRAHRGHLPQGVSGLPLRDTDHLRPVAVHVRRQPGVRRAGQSAHAFGVEMIALLHPARELPAFFHHELFHIYQAQQVGAAAPPDDTQPVWWALWNKGLATYVSWKLNPTLTAPEIFWTRATWKRRCSRSSQKRRG